MKRFLIILAVVLLTGCSAKNSDKPTKKTSSSNRQKEQYLKKENVKIYIPSKDGLTMKEKTYKLQPSPKEIVEAVINNNVLFPKRAKLLSVRVKETQAIVDFNNKLLTNPGVGAEGEENFVYSIVNSLCQLKSIDSVVFYVNGNKIEELWGHIDLSEPLKAR